MGTGTDTQVPSQLTMWLYAFFAVGVLVAIAVLIAINTGVFDTHSLLVGAPTTRPSAALALIPLAVGLLSGATAAITHAIERNRA